MHVCPFFSHGVKMEKKEVRVRCRGCGNSFKLKIPVTDRSVSFKCPKCAKVLKIKVSSKAKKPEPAAAPSPAPPSADQGFDGSVFPEMDFGPTPGAQPPGMGFDQGGMPEMDFGSAPATSSGMEFERLPEFETSQLPDSASYHEGLGAPALGPTPGSAGSEFVSHSFDYAQPPAAQGAPPSSPQGFPSWVFMAGDMVKGPFTEDEIRTMIKQGEITPQTSMRMGERPWIQAGKVASFAAHFPKKRRAEKLEHTFASMKLLDEEEAPEKKPFYEDISAIAPYPVKGLQQFGIFAGIAFVLSTILCLNFFVGLLVNLAGWGILYGYLASVMRQTKTSSESPPPAWDFAKAKDMGIEGVQVLAVLAAFSLVPTSILLLLMIAAFLNAMPFIGFLLMVAAPLFFAASLLVVPASLVVFLNSGRFGLAFNPGKILLVLKEGGWPYLMLVAFSIAAGLACMFTALITSVLLVDIPVAGFLVGGIIMAVVFSYGHFIWFHVTGRFSAENAALIAEAASAG